MNKKLIFTWGWKEQPHINELVEVIFEARGDDTVMSFKHHDIEKNSTHNYAEGWKSTFMKLERVLDQVHSNS